MDNDRMYVLVAADLASPALPRQGGLFTAFIFFVAAWFVRLTGTPRWRVVDVGKGRLGHESGGRPRKCVVCALGTRGSCVSRRPVGARRQAEVVELVWNVSRGGPALTYGAAI